MSRSESQRRYLAYLSALALTVTPVVMTMSATQTAAASPASVSAEKLAALKERAAQPGGVAVGNDVWTECTGGNWSQNC